MPFMYIFTFQISDLVTVHPLEYKLHSSSVCLSHLHKSRLCVVPYPVGAGETEPWLGRMAYRGVYLLHISSFSLK